MSHLNAAIRQTRRDRAMFAAMCVLNCIGFGLAVRTGLQQDWPTVAVVWVSVASFAAAVAIVGITRTQRRLRELRRELTRASQLGVGA